MGFGDTAEKQPHRVDGCGKDSYSSQNAAGNTPTNRD